MRFFTMATFLVASVVCQQVCAGDSPMSESLASKLRMRLESFEAVKQLDEESTIPSPAAPAVIPTPVVPQSTAPPQRNVSVTPRRLVTPKAVNARVNASGNNSGAVDPWLFQTILNNYRARHRLPPVRYVGGNYDSIAAENNSRQSSYRTCGHYYSGGGIAQNAATGVRGAHGLLQMWANSPGHNALLLDRSATEFGISSDGWASTLVMPSRFLRCKDHAAPNTSTRRRGWRW